MDTVKKLGRSTLPKGEKKTRIIAFVPEKMVESLSYEGCKKIAEDEIGRAYEANKSKRAKK